MGDEDVDQTGEGGLSRRAFVRRMMAAGFVAPVVGSFSFAEMASAAGRNRNQQPNQYYPNGHQPPPYEPPPPPPPPHEHCEPDLGGRDDHWW
jgi:hypothetical protein